MTTTIEELIESFKKSVKAWKRNAEAADKLTETIKEKMKLNETQNTKGM